MTEANDKSFINVSSKRAADFHRQKKLFELKYL